MLNIKKYLLTLVGVGLGIGGGFLYWKYVGCTSGTCPISSNPINSSAYGAVMGGLLFSLFKKENRK
jgi:hypothetical protein